MAVVSNPEKLNVDPNWCPYRLTIPEAELKETWQAADKETQEKIQTSPYARWNDGAGEMIRTTEKLVKVSWWLYCASCRIELSLIMDQYGLFDRPELKTWHRGRVVLLGDAAHPTSPVSCTRELKQ